MTPTVNRHMAVVGMFDGLHAGHRFLLQRLEEEAHGRGLEPLAITFANHPLEIIAPEKAPKLLSTPAEKARLFESAGIKAHIIPFDNALRVTTAADFLAMLARQHGVAAMMLGFNNRFGHDAPADFNTYRRMAIGCGIELTQAPELILPNCHVSSSVIRSLLAEQGDAATAAEMLCRPYSISGTVTSGKRIGRTIGFPTANIATSDSRKLIPQAGVYAAEAITPDGTAHPAVVNIGRRPTVEKNGRAPLWVEAHLIGFDGDLYGRQLTIAFMARIRSEQRFPDLESLRQRIQQDTIEAARILLDHNTPL